MTDNKRMLAAAYRRLNQLKLRQCIDPRDLDSRPHPGQQEIIDDFGKTLTQWVVSGNRAGKSQILCRIFQWVFDEDYEFLPNVPQHFRDRQNKTLLLTGRTSKQLENALWTKIKAFMPHEDYREIRSGQVLQAVENKKTGNKIIFLSFENERQARERVQGFDISLIGVDEMPTSADFISEVIARVMTTRGMFLATFTPLVVSARIKQMVENAELPYAKRYKITLWQNPANLIPEVKERIEAEFAHLSRAAYETRVNGEWASHELAVFPWVPETMERPMPPTYHASWPHVVSEDPAPTSRHGYVILAQDPATRLWYVLKADYIDNMVNTRDTIKRMKKIAEGLNVVRWICDTAAAYYMQDAAAEGIHHVAPYDKNNRRDEMISNMNMALGSRVLVPPWNKNLMDEMLACSWDEANPERIKNSNKYHVLDSLRYAIDCLPKDKELPEFKPWHQELREASQAERMLKSQLSKATNKHQRQMIKGKMRKNVRRLW